MFGEFHGLPPPGQPADDENMTFPACLSAAWRRLDHWLLPPLCVFCGIPTEAGESGACTACQRDLPLNRHACPGCALPLGARERRVPCARCRIRPLPLENVIAPFRYAFPVDAAVHAIKFRRRLEFVPVLGGALTGALLAAGLDVDLLVPVPLNGIRHGIRGFNQALELARPVAHATGLPLSNAVARQRRTRPQTGLDRAARRRNVERAFAVTGEPAARHALIVDDVMTTGATVIELARCLRGAGVERVSALVAARRGGDGQVAATPRCRPPGT